MLITEFIPNLKDVITHAKEEFAKEFYRKPKITVYCPGCLNLIGDHVANIDGLVIDMALPLVCVVVGSEAEDKIIISTDFEGADEPKKINILDEKEHLPNWVAPLKEIMQQHKVEKGFLAFITCTIPINVGLGCYNAIKIALYLFIVALVEKRLEITEQQRIQLCERAERFGNIVDVSCTILTKAHGILYFDLEAYSGTLIQVKDSLVDIVLIDTGVRNLDNHHFMRITNDCIKLKKLLKCSSFREVTLEDVKRLKQKGVDPDLICKAEHVLREILRTAEAANAFKTQSYEIIGELLTASHCSLRDNFQMTCPKVDQIFDATMTARGVYGSRMTGLRPGGCIIKKGNIIHLVHHIETLCNFDVKFYTLEFFERATILENLE